MTARANASISTIQIRPAVDEDYSSIVDVWTAAGLGTRLTGRDSRDEFYRQLRLFPQSYLVATAGGRIVGVVLGTHDGRKGWINRLAVHPDYQRRGLAQSLVHSCDVAIRAAGVDIVAAMIEPDNAPSLALFQKLGYLNDAPVVYVRKLGRADV